MDHQALIQAYLDGELTEQQHAELSDWLAQSEANREALVRASILDTQINRQLQNADLHRFLDQIDIHAIQEVIDQTSADESDAFAAVMDAGSDSTTQLTPATPRLTLGRAMGVLTRAGGEYAGQKLRQYAVPLGLAAAFALALTLFLVFQGDSTPTPGQQLPDFTQTPDETADPLRAKAVATLSNTHNAAWSQDGSDRALARGSELNAGDRFTLTAGFAQITTLSGAIAILEAPVTVELMDNDNAIRLHAGKLVGICETESSKGFLVRTSHMDITDIGTRFGVACTTDGSAVRVIKGEVHATPNRPDAKHSAMTAGQTAIISTESSELTLTQLASDRFVTAWDAVASAPTLTGDIHYEPSIPSDLRTDAYENDTIRLFRERSNVVLKDAITVNLLRPGRYQDDALQQPVELKPASPVDTYLVHLDKVEVDGVTSSGVKSATITFDRPIVGLITSTTVMADAHGTLGLPDVLYGSMDLAGRFSGLDQSSEQFSEAVTISDDRRTLTLQISTGSGIDQFRVLVASKFLN